MEWITTLLGWLWTAYLYAAPFAIFCCLQVWLLARMNLESIDARARRLLGPALAAFVIGTSSFGAWAVNRAPSSDCPATYDKQGIHADC